MTAVRAATTTPSSAPLHRRVSVDTPEHVRLDYVLADLGSRAAAIAIDLAVLIAAIIVLGLALYYADALGGFMEFLSGTVLTFAAFFAQWGYFMLFEALDGGRTPGKRAMGLRVIHAGGEPLTFRGSALRNLIRVVDFQPAGSALAGAVCILVSRRAQRLGDLVAGTIVVQDATGSDVLGADELPPARVGRALLSVEQFELLAGYMARRDGLAPEVLLRVSASVREALSFAIQGYPEATTGTHDEQLARLYEDEAPRHAARRGGASLQAALMARERREEWAKYVGLVEKGRKHGLTSLSQPEIRAFGQLYRGITADLARARTYGASQGLLGTVQRWAGAGHNLLYRARGRVAVSVIHWMVSEFPGAVRLHSRQILLASLLFYGPAVATYMAVREDPLLGRTLAGPGMLTRAENTERDNINARYLERDVGAAEMPVFASRLVTNNVGVTFIAFAGGLLAGAGTLMVLLANGISLGGIFGAYANEGVAGVILVWVFPHGFIELTAICIAGGAGFGLGSALLMPGRRTRAEALMERGRTFLSLIAGTSLMLVVAGLVEGFFSPLALPASAKLTFGAVTAVLLVLYFGFSGRRGREPRNAAVAATH